MTVDPERAALTDAALTPEWSEAELLPRLHDGEEEASAIYYRAFVGPLIGLARRLLRYPDEAEDIAHRVLAEGIRSLNTYDPSRGPLLKWLFGILRHRVKDEMRRRRDEVGFQDLQDSMAWMADSQSLEDDIAQILLRDQLQQLIEELRPRERGVIYLHHFLGFPYEEVASKLGMTGATEARQYGKRARDKLRQLLIQQSRGT